MCIRDRGNRNARNMGIRSAKSKKLSLLILALGLILLPQQLLGRLVVLEPASLASLEIKHSLANFGKIPYGKGRLEYTVVLANPVNACLKDHSFDLSMYKEPVVLLFRRSDECKLIHQAHLAEISGASLILIVDNREEDIEKTLLISVDTKIRTPACVIERNSGDQLIDYLEKNKNGKLRIAMDLVVPKKTKPEIKIWLTSGDPNFFEFLKDFQPFFEKVKQYVTLTPYYAAHVSASSGRESFNANLANQDCISGGRYCRRPVKKVEFGEVSGKEIIMQDLTQLCLFNVEGERKWWDYITGFNIYTSDTDKHLTKVGANVEAVKKCVEKSFMGPDQQVADNSILSGQRDAFFALSERYLMRSPMVLLNDMDYRGCIGGYPEALFEAICSAMEEPVKDVCPKKQMPKPDPIPTSANVWNPVILSVVFLLCCLLGLGLTGIYVLNRKMRSDAFLTGQVESNHVISLADTTVTRAGR
eukprot:TRINITY_DN1530_c0_g2_i1.p1 TRINITY_DN1530_c0_g2~~TRINITY_DN1530_c0_g2_i1.p1  ORF type:complete len:474 (-),score=83.41 TRINITY_DN1530_c0_g2_i1:29-1450(-)